MNKHATGVVGLDKMIGGGLPEGSVLSVIAPPGTGKSTFCNQFISEGLKLKEPCVFMVTSSPIDEIKKNLNIPKGAKIIFVDGYSWRTPGTKNSTPDVKVISSISNLNEVNRTIIDAIKAAGMDKTPGRFAMDSLSDILLQSDSGGVARFLEVLTALIQSSNIIGLIVVEDGLHAQKDISLVQYVTAGTIQMKIDGENRFIRIAKLTGSTHPLSWIQFNITTTGLTLKAEEVF